MYGSRGFQVHIHELGGHQNNVIVMSLRQEEFHSSSTMELKSCHSRDIQE